VGEVVLVTERLQLVLESPAEALARVEALSPAERAEVSPAWLARVRTTSVGDPWTLGFSVTDRLNGAALGGCGFKGPPDAEGIVEIAYGVDPTHRGRGYATEAARALVTFAFDSGLVHLIRAHTKLGNTASERVLAKCGFERIGEVIDPEDGLVWRWERTSGSAQPTVAPDGTDQHVDSRDAGPEGPPRR
jgi:RimJ/RimL family protein N-acetyltransferase